MEGKNDFVILEAHDVSAVACLSWDQILVILKAGHNCRTCGTLQDAKDLIQHGKITVTLLTGVNNVRLHTVTSEIS